MVLVFAETQNGIFKKAAFEAVTYGKHTADALQTDCAALVLGQAENAGQLGKYGASKVYHAGNTAFDQFDSQTFAATIADAANQVGASVVVLSHSSKGKALIGRIAVKLNAGSVAGANSAPTIEGDKFVVRKGVYSGKAFADFQITSDKKVISVMGNSIPITGDGSEVATEDLNLNPKTGRIKVKEVKRESGGVPLPEAELVVSAGRGMKGPENWGIIEELANTLGATTACSRPVADIGWRPHHEHVGQTGVAIRPNLYIAAGISGAIQHLAGVNNSKTIVVINKDPEAPFFKAADYGVVGDLFEVVPKLTEALKEFKA